MTIQEEMAARAEKRKAASRKAKQQSIATARAFRSGIKVEIAENPLRKGEFALVRSVGKERK